jgi:hypothetical protein
VCNPGLRYLFQKNSPRVPFLSQTNPMRTATCCVTIVFPVGRSDQSVCRCRDFCISRPSLKICNEAFWFSTSLSQLSGNKTELSQLQLFLSLSRTQISPYHSHSDNLFCSVAELTIVLYFKSYQALRLCRYCSKLVYHCWSAVINFVDVFINLNFVIASNNSPHCLITCNYPRSNLIYILNAHSRINFETGWSSFVTFFLLRNSNDVFNLILFTSLLG